MKLLQNTNTFLTNKQILSYSFTKALKFNPILLKKGAERYKFHNLLEGDGDITQICKTLHLSCENPNDDPA